MFRRAVKSDVQSSRYSDCVNVARGTIKFDERRLNCEQDQLFRRNARSCYICGMRIVGQALGLSLLAFGIFPFSALALEPPASTNCIDIFAGFKNVSPQMAALGLKPNQAVRFTAFFYSSELSKSVPGSIATTWSGVHARAIIADAGIASTDGYGPTTIRVSYSTERDPQPDTVTIDGSLSFPRDYELLPGIITRSYTPLETHFELQTKFKTSQPEIS